MFINFKKPLLVASLSFVLCFVLFSVPCVRFVDARIHTIVVPLHYSTIQYAINNASDGDTILVKSGSYTEKLVINKAISLIGEGKDSTTIYCGGDSYSGGPTIVVKADGVNITGFTLKNIITLPTNGAKSFSAHYGARSGIHLLHVDDCNIYENEIVDCGVGVWFYSSQNNNVFENTIKKSSYGIVVSQSQNNYIQENEVSLCYYGLFLSSCSYNVFRNNVMTNNSYNFDVSGTQLAHYNNDVGSSNLVNGKKVYYFVNSADLEISPESYPDASLVFVVNCINVNVKNLTLSNGGLFIVNSSDSVITNNKISNTNLGVLIRSCSGITVSNNVLSSIDGTAILMESCDRNLIENNTVESTNGFGIRLVASSDNSITRNLVMETIGHGVNLDRSYKNTVFENVVTNSETGIRLTSSAENIIKNNKIFSDEFETQNIIRAVYGIWLSDNCDKTDIIANTIVNCEQGIILEHVSVYVSVIGNNITSCDDGLVVGVRASTFASNTIYNSKNFDVLMFQNYYGLYNTFYNNNFIDNAHQTNQSILNDWVYGSNGNYWSSYNGADLNGDGIGDTPHVLDDKNQDIYPLVVPVERFDVGTFGQNNYYIDMVTNSVVTNFVCNPDQETSIKFNVDMQTGNHSFCRITIPKDFIDFQGEWVVLVNDEPVSLTETETTKITFLNFTYDNTAHSVEITGTTSNPEYEFWIILPVILITALIVFLVVKKR